MTVLGSPVDTSGSRLLLTKLSAPTFQQLMQRRGRPDELTLIAPASWSPVRWLGRGPLLVVTATGREADDLAAELRGGDVVARLLSWETLPHERLSPVLTLSALSSEAPRRLVTDDAQLPNRWG